MADRTEDSMNLDLNLGPVNGPSPVLGPVTGPSTGEAVNVNDNGNGNGNGNGRGVWNSSFIRDALRQRLHRNRVRWRRGHFVQLPLGSLELMVDDDANGGDVGGGDDDDGGAENGTGTVQAGEGSVSVSVAPESTSPDEVKTCENNVIAVDNGALDDKEDVEKANSEGSFFDCNICFELAREPVVTCCGHLFCWPCIYKWLHIHSDARECPAPVCKGEVTLTNVTPIYGRGNNVVTNHGLEEDSDILIPLRPSARRVESLRQTILRTPSSIQMEEMFRRLGARFESTRNFFLSNDGDDLPARIALHRIMTTRALRREQNPPVPPEDVVDLTQDRPEEMLRRPPIINRSGQLPRIREVPTTERTREAPSHQSPPARSQDLQPPSVDDRDSFSSIGAVIHGESQTMDTAAEIDSVVSLSTSSSRRRNEPSRTSDVDSGDSRATRRRLD